MKAPFDWNVTSQTTTPRRTDSTPLWFPTMSSHRHAARQV